jgi:hypothetical protein
MNHLPLRFNYRGSILRVFHETNLDCNDFKKLRIASACRYSLQALQQIMTVVLIAMTASPVSLVDSVNK